MKKLCKKCGSLMRLDDVDGFSTRNCKRYWECNSCDATCNEVVRKGVAVSVEWAYEYECLSISEILGLGD